MQDYFCKLWFSINFIKKPILCCRDLKKDYNWKRERPWGPHRHQPPNRLAAGARAAENYRYIIDYPEKYTVKKLKGGISIREMELTFLVSSWYG